MRGVAVSHSNGRQQRAEEASLVRLVIRARQVRGGPADLVQGNGILLCVGWCRRTRKTVVGGASGSNHLALFLKIIVKKLNTAVARVAQRLSWLLYEPLSLLYEL